MNPRHNNQHTFSRVIFWDPCLSPHKANLFESLAKINPHLEIICCVDQALPDDRKEMGWTVSDPEGYRNIISPDGRCISALVAESPLTTLHIFSGLRWIPSIVTALAAVKSQRACYMIMSEPRVMDGWAGKLRLLQSWLTEGYHRRNAAAILAIGRNGPPWFFAAGYPKNKVVPFAYFVPPPITSLASPTEKLRVGYLGRLVRMKGIFDIVSAVSLLECPVMLDFAGNGPEEHNLKLMCSTAGVDSKFRGVLAISEIGDFFSHIDVLVLASTSKDGWGAVISEALMAGVPVIATPMVGASVVLQHNSFGRCVPAGSPTAIKNAILDLKDCGELAIAKREVRARAATQILSAQAGATYLTKLISWLEGKTERPLDFYSIQDDAH